MDNDLPCDMCATCNGCKIEHIHTLYEVRDCECPPKDGDSEKEGEMEGLGVDEVGEEEDGTVEAPDKDEDNGNNVDENDGDDEDDDDEDDGDDDIKPTRVRKGKPTKLRNKQKTIIRKKKNSKLTRCWSTTSEDSNDDTKHSLKRSRMDGDIGEDEQVDLGTIAPLPSAGTHRGTHDSPFSVSSGEGGPSS